MSYSVFESLHTATNLVHQQTLSGEHGKTFLLSIPSVSISQSDLLEEFIKSGLTSSHWRKSGIVIEAGIYGRSV